MIYEILKYITSNDIFLKYIDNKIENQDWMIIN